MRTEKKDEIVEKFKNYMDVAPSSGMPWSKEALAKMEKVPPFVLGMAKQTIEGRARERGDKMVTPSIIEEVFTNIMPASAKQAMGIEVTEEELKEEELEKLLGDSSWKYEKLRVENLATPSHSVTPITSKNKKLNK